MIDEQTILAAERLRDDLGELKGLMRKRYAKASRQVSSDEIRKKAAILAETWLVELAPIDAVVAAIGDPAIADLNVHFQRILTFAEHSTTRTKYDAEFRAILDDYSVNVVVPLKKSRGGIVKQPQRSSTTGPARSVFIGQSFSEADEPINKFVFDVLTGIGLDPVTGEKPKADRISDKVKGLIEQQAVFVGIFTKRDKIARKQEWTTSTWVIDEKAYALGRQKPLILIKEQGVVSIGGIQGDYEYFEFTRDRLELLAVKLIGLFSLTNNGLAK
jgi:hypothetical protein